MEIYWEILKENALKFSNDYSQVILNFLHYTSLNFPKPFNKKKWNNIAEKSEKMVIKIVQQHEDHAWWIENVKDNIRGTLRGTDWILVKP